jgi:REP element-mobilizing transposase RayT
MHVPEKGKRALRKGRYSQRNRIYFITTVTEKRVRWFEQYGLAHELARKFQDQKCLPGAECLCWVIMPDHVHLLIRLGDIELSKVMKAFKAITAQAMNRAIGRKGRFWQPGFYDHGLRKEENIREIARYIVANPLRAKLVKKIGDYPFWNAVWL